MRHTTPILTTALALLVIPGVAAAGNVATEHDAVTTPGQAVTVSAKFEKGGWRFWRPDIKDAPATIRVQGVTVAARTDRDGVVKATVRPHQVGVYDIESSLDRDPGKVAKGRLFVLDPTRPAAVVDLDGTLSKLPDLLVPLFGGIAPTYAGAPELLRDLAVTHTIIYLTARDDAFTKKSRKFLKRHGYPDGPILFNDLGITSKAELAQLKSGNHAKFKLSQLLALEERGVNLSIGIGNAETDAEAYERVGLPSYIRTKKENPGRSYRFLEYSELRTRLIADGVLPQGMTASVP